MKHQPIKPKLPVTFMYVPEEEIGSPYNRRLIEAAVEKAKYVLVTEPDRDGGGSAAENLRTGKTIVASLTVLSGSGQFLQVIKI